MRKLHGPLGLRAVPMRDKLWREATSPGRSPDLLEKLCLQPMMMAKLAALPGYRWPAVTGQARHMQWEQGWSGPPGGGARRWATALQLVRAGGLSLQRLCRQGDHFLRLSGLGTARRGRVLRRVTRCPSHTHRWSSRNSRGTRFPLCLSSALYWESWMWRSL